MTATRSKLESAVVAAMSEASERLMVWGKDDCALWCARPIQEVLGYDPVASFRGRYSTRRGAMRVLGKKGMLGAIRAAALRHKWKRINPTMARPGDVGLVWTEYAGKPVLATAICRASDWFVARNERGFTAVRASDMAIAWSVLDDVRPGARASLGNPDGLRRPMTPIVCHEPVSAAILLTLAIEATPVALAITNAIVMTAISEGVSIV